MRFPRSCALSAVFLLGSVLTLLSPADADAQQAASPDVTVGRPMNGQLAVGDTQLNSGEFIDYYTLQGGAGQRFRITVDSTAFDTWLMVRGAGLSVDNDDRGQGDTNSQLDVTLPRAGSFLIGVTSYQPGESGGYTLLVRADGSVGTAMPSALERPLATGTTQGALQATNPTLDGGAHAEPWAFNGRAGQSIDLTMRSSDFDSYLILTGPNDYRVENDDHPGLGVHSRIQTTLPTDGNYTVWATSYRPATTGAYTLAFQPDAQATAPDLGQWQQSVPTVPTGPSSGGPLVLPASLSGSLAPGDGTLSSGEFVDEYVLDLQSGNILDVRMQSSQFDTYLMVRGPGDFRQDNDDAVGQAGTNAAIRVTIPATGRYRVLATSYQPGETGSYTLQVRVPNASGAQTPVAPTDSPSPTGDRPLPPDSTVSATFTAQDPTRSGGQPTQRWTFEGQRGQRVRLDMNAGPAAAGVPALDTWLTLFGPGGFQEQNDDRGDGSTDSRIVAVLPADGTYSVEASTFRAQLGGYTLRLSTQGLADDTTGPQPVSPTLAGAAALPIGTVMQGTLDASDAVLANGEYHDVWRFAGQAGTTYTFTMESGAFDTWIGVTGPGGFYQFNDDAQGTNSRLEITLPTTADYQVVATSYAAAETGAYRLVVREGTERQRAERSRVFAVLAGITDYETASDLPFCADDAIKLEESLQETGLLHAQSSMLTDRAVTRESIRLALAQVAREAGPDDVVLFFFSGHGNQRPNADELDGMDETLVVSDGEITDDELNDWMADIRARMTIVAIDSCFAGGFARDVISRPDRMGIFSSEEDVTSNVAERFKAGGYLSHFLRQALAGAADTDPADGQLSAGELTQYLRRQWAQHMMDERTSTSDSDQAWQNLVIDRGAVKVGDIVMVFGGASAR